MNRRVILILLGGVGFLCLCTVSFGTLFLVFTDSTVPSDVSVLVDAPRAVPLNEPFAIVVTVRNLTAVSQTLDSIDIQNSYLEGVQISQSDPPFSDDFEIPLVGYQSYTYFTPIFGNDTLEIELVGEGIAEGEFEGTIDVCINNGADCVSRTLSIEVGETTGR
ncbi:MAG: hypothetical protein AAF490_06455 [Chloroflexota bacterium]